MSNQEAQDSVSLTQSDSSRSLPGLDPTGPITPQLETIVSQVTSVYGGRAGIAVALPGSGASISQAGSLRSDVAWSTSKVPIAVALVRQTGNVDSNIVNAITMSDNFFAEAMWASLGDPRTAGAATDQILRLGGDSHTVMNTEVTRPGYTAFGQTPWALSDQAVFGANVQCIPGGMEVAVLMKAISPDQAYGLGRIPGSAFKGGWGPDLENNYLIRQFVFLYSGDNSEEKGQYVGVAIAAKPGDGTYELGQAMLNDVADALQKLTLPAGRCR